MPETDLEKAICTAERLRPEIAIAKVNAAGQQFNITTSIGVTTLQKTDTNLQTLRARPDRFLYQAKKMGRNQVVTEQS